MVEAKKEIFDVFLKLGLETEEKRDFFKRLEQLGNLSEGLNFSEVVTFAPSQINTTEEPEDYAQLERDSE